jgi:hypothetical protein
MKRTLSYITITLLLILLSSCSLKPTVTVTIYNNTSVTSGSMLVIYGDYNGYADGEAYITNPVFPYTMSISDDYLIVSRFVHRRRVPGHKRPE